MDFLSSTAMEEDLKDDGSDKIIEELVAACASRDLAALDVISRSTAHLQTLKQESVRLRLQSDHNEVSLLFVLLPFH